MAPISVTIDHDGPAAPALSGYAAGLRATVSEWRASLYLTSSRAPLTPDSDRRHVDAAIAVQLAAARYLDDEETGWSEYLVHLDTFKVRRVSGGR